MLYFSFVIVVLRGLSSQPYSGGQEPFVKSEVEKVGCRFDGGRRSDDGSATPNLQSLFLASNGTIAMCITVL